MAHVFSNRCKSLCGGDLWPLRARPQSPNPFIYKALELPRGPGVDQERHSDSDQDARHHHIHIGARLRLALLALLGLDGRSLDSEVGHEGGRADDAENDIGEGDTLLALHVT